MGKIRLSNSVGAEESPQKSRRRKIKLITIIAGAVLILGVAAFAVWFVFFRNSDEKTDAPNVNPPAEIEKPKFFSPLTGREVANEEITTRPVTAVMIENSLEARPQSGLVDAGVVFEAIAEGGITRFIALYQEAEPSLIGPIRSARPYFLEWAAAFDPAVIHVGGSDEALAMLNTGRYGLNIDEVDNSVIFRARDRYAPHNAYTDFTKYSGFLNRKGKTTSDFVGWTRQDGQGWCNCPDEAVCDCPPLEAGNINIGVSVGSFAVHYDYDIGTNNYKRSIGGTPHKDREKGQVSPDVVIALRSNYGLMADGLHSRYQTTGENDVYIFQNGDVITGKWRKADAWSQIKFFDITGTEIKLNRGQVWITAVGQDSNVSWQ